jgi:hypothetical protein
MGKHRIKPNYRRRALRLPDLDHCKAAVLNSLGSPASRRVYEYAIDQFIAWYCSEPRGFVRAKSFERSPGGGRCGAAASRRTLSGTWLEPAAREQAWSTLHRTTCGGPARNSATIAAVNWSRFSSCWATHPFKRRNAISAANRISDTPSTIFLTSQRTDGRRKTMLNLPERKPRIL